MANKPKLTRKELIDYYNRCLTFNLFVDREYVEYDKYKYKVVGKDIWLKEINSKITKSLVIDPIFDVFDVYWGKKYEKVKSLDLGSITKLNKTFDSSILEVVYMNHVKKIPSECFFDCEKLRELHIDNCISIGEYAFCRCNIGKLHADKVKYVGKKAFSESAIEKLYLGNTNLVNYSLDDMYLLNELYMKSCNFAGMNSGLFISTRNVKYIDFGIFNDSKHHFYVMKLDDLLKKYHLKNYDYKPDTYCYELLYGKLKPGYIAVRNKEINYKCIYNKPEIHLELSQEIINKGLVDYYISYWMDELKDYGKIYIKVNDNIIQI